MEEQGVWITHSVLRSHSPCFIIKQSIYLLAIRPKYFACSVFKTGMCGGIGSKTFRPDNMRESWVKGAGEPRHHRCTACFFNYAPRQQVCFRELLCQIS